MKIKLVKDCNLGKEIGRKNEVIEVAEETGKKLVKLNLAFAVSEEQLELPLEEEATVEIEVSEEAPTEETQEPEVKEVEEQKEFEDINDFIEPKAKKGKK